MTAILPVSEPTKFRMARLGDICRIVGGSTPVSSQAEFWGGEIVWVTPTDLGRLKTPTIRTSERGITETGYRSCGAEIVPAGSVVMSSRAPIGHLGIADLPLCTNQGCKTFVPGPEVDTLYLYFALRASVPDLRAMGSGATFAEVSKSALATFEIPLPDQEAQWRIAKHLEAALLQIEKLRAPASAQLEAARALPAAFLRSVFDSEESSQWPTVPLSNLVRTPLRTGTSVYGGTDPNARCLTLSSVRNGRLDLAASKPVHVSDAELARHSVRATDNRQVTEQK